VNDAEIDSQIATLQAAIEVLLGMKRTRAPDAPPIAPLTGAIDVERLNRELTEDEQLVPADHLARHRNPVPREDLEATFVDLWTYESNGGLISDQDAVVERSRDRGFIPSTKVKRTPTHVVRKRFKQVRYLAPGDREHFEPLISVMRLPRFDGPGMMFDRGLAVEETIPARQELVELIPAPDAPAKPAASEVA